VVNLENCISDTGVEVYVSYTVLLIARFWLQKKKGLVWR
jgi:hypothetical protein